jgi:transposase
MKQFNTILGILEFHEKGLTYKQTQERFHVGASTVNSVLEKYEALGIPLEDLKSRSAEAVEELFYPEAKTRRKAIPLPDFQRAYDRIHAKGSRANIVFCWMEYITENPEGYRLTQYTEHYNRYVERNFGKRTSMGVERIPGQNLYIDWVGDQPELLADSQTGEIRKVHIFTTTMAFSSYVYAQAFPDEKQNNFVTGVVNAIRFYGGVPEYLVPDNLKAAISKNTRDELVITSVFSDIESFYDVVVLPPPPRKPRGKATVESHVRYLETHLIERLKETTFFSIEAINEKVMEIITDINNETHKREFSRKALFDRYDKPALRGLPDGAFSPWEYGCISSLPDNYHVPFLDHYYSVPYTYLGKPIIVKASFTEIVLCDQHNQFICKHKRAYKEFPKYITNADHMPASHLFAMLNNTKDGAYYRRWAEKFGPSMGKFIDLMLKKANHEEQAYKSCLGILLKSEKKPYLFVDGIAKRFLDIGMVRYSYFIKLLGCDPVTLDQQSQKADFELPDHENIRGKEYYE